MLRTDHDLSKWTLNHADSTGRFVHWRRRLSKSEVDAVYKAKQKAPSRKSDFTTPHFRKDTRPLKNDLKYLEIDAQDEMAATSSA